MKRVLSGIQLRIKRSRRLTFYQNIHVSLTSCEQAHNRIAGLCRLIIHTQTFSNGAGPMNTNQYLIENNSFNKESRDNLHRENDELDDFQWQSLFPLSDEEWDELFGNGVIIP